MNVHRNPCRWIAAAILLLPVISLADDPVNRTPRPPAPLTTRVYQVADLIVPINGDRDSELHYDDLIQLIEQSVAPESWQDRKHGGSMQRHDTTLSLIVRQTNENHDRIEKLFNQIRRLQDSQIVTEFRVFTAHDTFWDDFNPSQDFSDEQMRLLIDKIQSSQKSHLIYAPKVTTFDGQTATLQSNNPGELLSDFAVRSTISPDGRSLNTVLSFVTNAENVTTLLQQSIGFSLRAGMTKVIALDAFPEKTGSSRLLNIGFLRSRGVKIESDEAENPRMFLMVTQRIIQVEEEEEELLSNR